MIRIIGKIFLVSSLLILVAGLGYTRAEEGDDIWERTDKMNTSALEAFLVKCPNNQYAPLAKVRISLLKKIANIQVAQEKPGFVIPFKELGQRWESWQKHGNEKAILVLFATKVGDNINIGIRFMGGENVSFDEYGTPRAPTGDGSIIGFQTNDLKLGWLNDITFVSEGNDTLYFGVIKNSGGLVHLLGKGKCIMPNGKETTLK